MSDDEIVTDEMMATARRYLLPHEAETNIWAALHAVIPLIEERALRRAAEVADHFLAHKLKNPDDKAVCARTATDISYVILSLIPQEQKNETVD